MKNLKKYMLMMVVVLLAVSLAACGSSAASTAADENVAADENAAANTDSQSAASSIQNSGTAAVSDSKDMPVSQKLLFGTLMLEDTDQAVTAEEAAALLPLWKAVNALESSDTTAPEELAAVYEQIQEAMTADQIAAVEAMDLGPESMQAVAEKLGIEMPSLGGKMDTSSMTDEQKAAMAQRLAEGGASGGPGGGPGGGPEQGAIPGQNQPGTDSTSGSENGTGRSRSNNFLLEPLITLLTERAAGS